VGGVIEWAMQVIYLYLFTNGNTSDGKFSAQDRQNLDFSGHPDTPANSPYKLPWAEGNEQECVQNPMGIWSHYPDDGQAYAYDFNHDAGTEVLCSRSGIVYEMDQVQLNNNTSDWNHIEILALKTHPAGTANAMPGVSPPAGVTHYADGFNAVEAGTLFPPFWDVNGVAWPCLRTAEALTTPPPPIPLHPSAAILPAGTTLTGGLAAGTLFTFVDPDFDRGFPGVAYPDGSKFSDGTTVIPAGVVFAPDAPRPPTLITPMYRPGTSFGPVRVNFSAKPYAEPGVFPSTGGFTPAPGATFLDGVAIPAGVILPPDCGAAPAWLPMPHPVTPMYLPGTMFLPITDVKFFNAGTGYVAEGTPFPAIPAADADHSTAELNHQWCTPITHTFCEYGHALAGYSSLQNHTFDPATATTPAVVRKLIIGATRTPIPGTPREDLTDVFGTAENSEILGRRVEQGRVIMLSGDTGISAYNHLHTHVSHFASKRRFQKDRPDKNGQYYYWTFSLPFAYADAVHSVEHGFREAGARDGVPRAMTWYDSKNTRTGP
jgi:hypothetical protein